MIFPTINNKELIERLTPKTKRVKMVLDTDTFNEVDDQFALAYALCSPERLDVQAVYAAPFSAAFFDKLINLNKFQTIKDPRTGMELSYNEILNVFDLVGVESNAKVFKGSDKYMTDDKPVESDAARDLVKKAMAADDILYVVAIGEITNVASAILMEPEIIKKIVIVWLAGHPLYWPQTYEFNIGQDLIASQLIFNCKVPLVLIPCMGVSSHLTTTAPELMKELYGKSKIGTYLTKIVLEQLSSTEATSMLEFCNQSYLKGVDDYGQELFQAFKTETAANSRIIWDISTIGYMINPNWCPSSIIAAPHLMPDMTWNLKDPNHIIRICNYIYRDYIYGDMFKKLSQADNK